MDVMAQAPGFTPLGIDRVRSRIAEITGSFGPSSTTQAAPLAPAAGGAPAVRAMSLGAGGTLGSFASSLEAAQSALGANAGAVDGALAWARTQLGTPYAAVNPFRFGDVPWDGGAHPSVNGNGKIYQYPAGTKVYDCSGFATAVWRRAGIDLAEYNATTSQTMLERIPRVEPTQAAPGDLVVYDTERDGITDHVVVHLGEGMAIESTPSGVVIKPIDWRRTVGVVRPSLLKP
jgi:cell wall-associated NlpC family hydrolase